MPIHALHVGNFKGLDESQRIPIKPITLFIGPNSSGKSSCIHAMACLAQTLKLSNNTRPIILDDEFAQVHLGRFIEVIHSRSYDDAIELGVEINHLPLADAIIGGKHIFSRSDIAIAKYSYRSTKRTQDVYLEKGEFGAGQILFNIKKTSNTYSVTNSENAIRFKLTRDNGFIFKLVPSFTTFTPDIFQTYYIADNLQEEIGRQLRNTLYLGPFRQSPLRRYPTRGSNPTEVGSQGEATITLLANDCIQSRSRTHTKQISEWLNILGLARNVDVSRVATSDLFDISVTLNDNVSLPIADLGYGLSQILPVLTQCSFAPEGATLLFEQPELHLHQFAAEQLAKVFVTTAKTKNINIVAETHSPDLFRQIMLELRAGSISLDDVVAYKVHRDHGKSIVEEIVIERDDDDFEVYDPWKGLLSG